MPRTPVRAAALLVAVCLSPAWAAFDQAQYDEAARTILCDCGCHPQSVHDCACGRAAEMRSEIAALVEGGMTGEAVIAKYVAEHGDKIRVAPTGRGFNLVAWAGPFAGLLLAIVSVVLVLRAWNRARADEETRPRPDALPEDDPYVVRLRRQIEELE